MDSRYTKFCSPESNHRKNSQHGSESQMTKEINVEYQNSAKIIEAGESFLQIFFLYIS